MTSLYACDEAVVAGLAERVVLVEDDHVLVVGRRRCFLKSSSVARASWA